MRIAMLAPIAWRTPPRGYGPWELVTSLLTEALVARGVDVTLFATMRQPDRAPRSTRVVPAPYCEDPNDRCQGLGISGTCRMCSRRPIASI